MLDAETRLFHAVPMASLVSYWTVLNAQTQGLTTPSKSAPHVKTKLDWLRQGETISCLVVGKPLDPDEPGTHRYRYPAIPKICACKTAKGRAMLRRFELIGDLAKVERGIPYVRVKQAAMKPYDIKKDYDKIQAKEPASKGRSKSLGGSGKIEDDQEPELSAKQRDQKDRLTACVKNLEMSIHRGKYFLPRCPRRVPLHPHRQGPP